MKCVKKLVHIVDPGRLHDHTVISAHSHGDQFGLKTSPVRVSITATRYHLKFTVIPP